MSSHRPQLIEYLGNECAHCSMAVDKMVRQFGNVHRMFKFHHVVSQQKSENYKNLIERKLSAEQLDEIDKCILLCGNCHDVLHAQGVDAEVKFSIEIDGRWAEQTLQGNLITDVENSTVKFLSNERLYLSPYLLQLGERGERKFVYGTELKDGLMIKSLAALRDSKVFKLYSYSDQRLLFQARLSDRDKVSIEYDIRMELPLVLNPIDEGEMLNKGWIRNGVALLADGRILTSGNVSFTIENPIFLTQQMP